MAWCRACSPTIRKKSAERACYVEGMQPGMEAIEPSELDFDRLGRAFASARSPAWRAAAAGGVDLSLLARNLELTPAERMQQLEDALRLMGR